MFIDKSRYNIKTIVITSFSSLVLYVLSMYVPILIFLPAWVLVYAAIKDRSLNTIILSALLIAIINLLVLGYTHALFFVLFEANCAIIIYFLLTLPLIS